MKKLLCALMLSMLLTTSCGDDQYIKGKYCPTYGFLNKDEVKCEGVQYKIIGGNIFWAIIFSETIVAPLYFFLFDLYEPL